MAPRSKVEQELLPVQPADAPALAESPYQTMIHKAAELDLDKLSKFFAMQQEWEKEQARKQFLAAISSFQGQIPVIRKTSHADFGEGKASYTYAPLENIAEGIRPFLVPNGLSYTWSSSTVDGVISVTCTLSHSAGHSISSTQIGTPDSSGGKAGIHASASTRSYLRRYTLMDVTGVTCADEDDDGQNDVVQEITQKYCTKEYFDANAEKWIAKLKENGQPVQSLVVWLDERNILLTPEQKVALETAIGKGNA